MLSTDFIPVNYDNGNTYKVKTWKINYHVNINPKGTKSNNNIRQNRLQLESCQRQRKTLEN